MTQQNKKNDTQWYNFIAKKHMQRFHLPKLMIL